MKGKVLREIQLIDTLLKYGKLKICGSDGDSFYEKFGIEIDENGKYNDSNSPINARTLRRQVIDLFDKGIFKKIENTDYYSIDDSNFMFYKLLDNDKWMDILNILLKNQEIDAYKYIRNYIDEAVNKSLFNNDELLRYSSAVKEPLQILSQNTDVIKKINSAMKNNSFIKVEYKNKEYSIYPICYIISRDCTRNYLCAIRRKKLIPPMELRYIKFLEELNKSNIDKHEYIEKLRKAWDIDLSKCKVKLMVLKGHDDSQEVIKELKKYLGNPIENNNSYEIYEGEIIGINDFKNWLRRYIEICIVLEPESLQKEFIAALKYKKKRYEEMS